MLASALLHPIRDLILKGTHSATSSYLGVTMAWVVISALVAWATEGTLWMPREAWPLVAVSAVGLALYYYGTLAALRIGNLSVYYPIIRSSPLAIVVISWALLEKTYAPLTVLGIGLIIFAGLAIQKTPGSLFDNPRALALAALAMLGSAIYSLADAAGMQVTSPATFVFWGYLIVSCILSVVCLVDGGGAHSWVDTLTLCWKTTPLRIVVAALASYASYYFILTAFQLRADAAAVSAVRQASIPVSVILAAIVLKEPRFLNRMGWATLLACGIAIIALS